MKEEHHPLSRRPFFLRSRFCRLVSPDHTNIYRREPIDHRHPANVFPPSLSLESIRRQDEVARPLLDRYFASTDWTSADRLGALAQVPPQQLGRIPTPEKRWGDLSHIQMVFFLTAMIVILYCSYQSVTYLNALQATDINQAVSFSYLARTVRRDNQRLADIAVIREEIRGLKSQAATSSAMLSSAKDIDSRRQINEELADLQHLLTIQSIGAPAQFHSREKTSSEPRALLRNEEVDSASEDYHIDQIIPLIPSAVAHRTHTGETDYWLVERPGSNGDFARMVPFATTDAGIAVHDLDEGYDHIITPKGQWLKYGP